MRTWWLIPIVVLAACSSGGDGDRGDDGTTSTRPGAEPVRLNEIQVLGTHNSYRGPMPRAMLELVTQFDEAAGLGLDYAHPPLDVQLEQQGARQLELDVWADPDGGLYADRRGNSLIGEPVPSGEPALDEPGFKVLHSADIDYVTSCLTFVACLEDVKAWSAENPRHLPVMILVEAKQTPTPDPAGLGFVDPPDFDATTFTALDAEIRSVFADDEMVMPRDRVDGVWPTLDDSRGKVLFALDNDALTDTYGGDILFTSLTGFVKLNDPIADAVRIREDVRAGYVVRTRADAETVQSRTNDPTMRDAALVSGAQWISTDYLSPDTRFSDYVVTLPGGGIVRCNPVVAPDCDVDQLKE